MDERTLLASARSMGLDSWDRHEPIAGGHGSTFLVWKDDEPYVVKGYRPGEHPGARERAALATLDGAGDTARLLAESDDPPHVVMSRLEGSGSLADALLGDDRDGAAGDLLRWVEAVAALHGASTPALRASFTAALSQRAPDAGARKLPDDFERAAQQYAVLLEELGLPPHESALEELRALPHRLASPRYEVLSPADTCPDNNLMARDRARLLDFEWAELRHAAWDVAYLKAPWPSCWCAWRLPDAEADRAVGRYLQLRDLTGDAQFAEDLALATFGWRVMTPAWFLRAALEKDDAELAPRRPSRRAFVLHRLGEAAASNVVPALAELAGTLHEVLQERWGRVPLALAPAFRLVDVTAGRDGHR